MSPSSTVHGGQHDTKYVTFELLLHAAFVADEFRDFMLEPARTSISDAADALPSVAMVQIGIRMSYLCISAEMCRQIRVLSLVWRGVGCGGWRGSPLASAFVWVAWGELWKASDGLKNDKKQLKVKQSRQTRVYLGFIRPKTGNMRFRPMAGLVGCTFDLI